MRADWAKGSGTLDYINTIIQNCAEKLSLELISTVLYGSRTKGDYSMQSDYEILVLLNNGTDIKGFIKFENTLRFELINEKFFRVKVITFTPEIFEEILYSDNVTGTFLYMICRDSIILYDKQNNFAAIMERLNSSSIKSEEEFMVQCVEFARALGSDKWERKWEKSLMQLRYLKNRRDE